MKLGKTIWITEVNKTLHYLIPLPWPLNLLVYLLSPNSPHACFFIVKYLLAKHSECTQAALSAIAALPRLFARLSKRNQRHFADT